MRNRCQNHKGEKQRDLSRSLMALQYLRVTDPKDQIQGARGLLTKYYTENLDSLSSFF